MRLRVVCRPHRRALCPRHREYPQADIEGRSINPSPVPHTKGNEVIEALESLSEDDQEVIRMWQWERLRPSEIAVEYGLGSRQAGHYKINAALGRLKAALAERGINDTTFE
jgi:DNA-directed RNA polymerase specialized sigma24 family protein